MIKKQQRGITPDDINAGFALWTIYDEEAPLDSENPQYKMMEEITEHGFTEQGDDHIKWVAEQLQEKFPHITLFFGLSNGRFFFHITETTTEMAETVCRKWVQDLNRGVKQENGGFKTLHSEYQVKQLRRIKYLPNNDPDLERKVAELRERGFKPYQPGKNKWVTKMRVETDALLLKKWSDEQRWAEMEIVPIEGNPKRVSVTLLVSNVFDPFFET